MKKLICIYLMLVMVLTGCGKTIYIYGIDSILEKQDENENSVGISSAKSTPSPTPSPSPTPDLTPILINETEEPQWIFKDTRTIQERRKDCIGMYTSIGTEQAEAEDICDSVIDKDVLTYNQNTAFSDSFIYDYDDDDD